MGQMDRQTGVNRKEIQERFVYTFSYLKTISTDSNSLLQSKY